VPSTTPATVEYSDHWIARSSLARSSPTGRSVRQNRTPLGGSDHAPTANRFGLLAPRCVCMLPDGQRAPEEVSAGRLGAYARERVAIAAPRAARMPSDFARARPTPTIAAMGLPT